MKYLRQASIKKRFIQHTLTWESFLISLKHYLLPEPPPELPIRPSLQYSGFSSAFSQTLPEVQYQKQLHILGRVIVIVLPQYPVLCVALCHCNDMTKAGRLLLKKGDSFSSQSRGTGAWYLHWLSPGRVCTLCVTS